MGRDRFSSRRETDVRFLVGKKVEQLRTPFFFQLVPTSSVEGVCAAGLSFDSGPQVARCDLQRVTVAICGIRKGGPSVVVFFVFKPSYV